MSSLDMLTPAGSFLRHLKQFMPNKVLGVALSRKSCAPEKYPSGALGAVCTGQCPVRAEPYGCFSGAQAFRESTTRGFKCA